MRVLSLGGGVQSSTLLLMSLLGELPRLDAAIFADTGWETPSTYAWLRFLEEQCEDAELPFYRVSAGNIREDGLEAFRSKGKRWGGSIPAFTEGRRHATGMIRRQCTSHYKIRPIARKIRELCGLKPVGRVPAGVRVEQVVGISLDEKHRARSSGFAWLERVHPLLLPMRYTRAHCMHWLESEGYPTPPKSACVCCPYHSDAWYRQLREQEPEEWERLCEFDDELRNWSRTKMDLFVHSSLVPMRKVDLSGGGQLELWGDCDGSCGV